MSACLYTGVGTGEVQYAAVEVGREGWLVGVASVEAGREVWLGCLRVSVQELVQERYTPQWRLDGRGDWDVCVSLYRSWSRRGTRLSGGWTGGVAGMSACLCTGVGPGEVHDSVEAGREVWLGCLRVSIQELVQERYSTLQWRLDVRGGW